MKILFTKSKLVLALLLSGATGVYSQFAFLYSSTGQEYGKANCVDKDNNYLEAALFSNTINIEPSSTKTLTSNGLIDIALVKYDQYGKMIWAKNYGGATTIDAPHGVDTDSKGNVYITGYFGNPNPQANQTANFNPDGSAVLTSKGSYDAYLAKYNADGDYQWAFGLSNRNGNTEERAWDICVDNMDNVYVGGAFKKSMDFNPLGTPNVKTLASQDVGLFLAKYNTDGINQWALLIDARDTSVFFEAYTAIDVDKNGDIYLAGNFRGSNVNFDPSGSVLLSSSGQTDMFLAKYKSDGSFVFANRIGGILTDIVSPGALKVDANNDIYFTGRISGTVNFNTSEGTNNVSGASLFLAKYNSDGNLIRVFGMPSNAGDGGHRVGFDSQNNVLVAGWMNGTVNFNPVGNSNYTAVSPTADFFLAKYTSSGNFLWALNVGAANSNENNICAGLAVDKIDNIYLTGQLFGTNADFDPSPNSQFILSSVGQNDCFIVKYDANGNLWKNPTDIISEKLPTDFILYQNYPNPFNPSTTINYKIPDFGHVSLIVYDILGRKVATLVEEYKEPGYYNVEFKVNGDGYTSGVYFYQLKSGSFIETKKMILIK